ncbi:MAG: hypothetical protein JWM00_401 [Candidatus Saccharibacteria bacterium]|nr:hypothetical protein [Candidatus Saccharibacteria bacterium]
MNEDPTTKRTTEVVETNATATAPEVEHDRQVSKVTQIIWYIAGVLIALLLVRAVLAMLGANLDNSFASFIYALTDPLVAPFRGLLQVGEFQAGVSRLEVETLLAAAVYALVTWGITKAVDLARKDV